MRSGMVTCPTCRGSGRARAMVVDGTTIEDDCVTCSGYGNVRVERVRTVLDLRVPEYRGLVDSLRAAKLAGAITRDHAHLTDPVTWLAEHAQSEVYRITRPSPTDVHDLRLCEHEADALPGNDPRPLAVYVEMLRTRVWSPLLEAQGWEPAEPDPDSGIAQVRAPSGAVYMLSMFSQTPALDVALARENVDVRRVLSEAQRIVDRTRTSLGGRVRKPRSEDSITGHLFGDKP